MAKKNKYSEKTREYARQWGRLTGRFKNATEENTGLFIKAVSEVMPYVNQFSMFEYIQLNVARMEEAKKRVVFAAEEYGKSNLGWKRLTENRVKEFQRMVADDFGSIAISPSMALEFAGLDEGDYLDYLSSEGLPVIYDRIQEEEGVVGWQTTPLDEVFSKYDTAEIANIQIIDIDGSIVFSGDNLRDYYDAFRELGDEGQYPIYDLDSYTYYDEFGREIVEFVATVTSYYP